MSLQRKGTGITVSVKVSLMQMSSNITTESEEMIKIMFR